MARALVRMANAAGSMDALFPLDIPAAAHGMQGIEGCRCHEKNGWRPMCPMAAEISMAANNAFICIDACMCGQAIAMMPFSKDILAKSLAKPLAGWFARLSWLCAPARFHFDAFVRRHPL